MVKEGKEKYAIAAVFAVTLVYLLVQFSNVMVYFDDYGYYSLSYGVPNYTGDGSYGFGELLAYLNYHYDHINGRLLGFFVWLSLYWLGGLRLVQISAALISCVLLFVIWKFTADKRYAVLSALVICCFYALFPMEYMGHGTYWFAAFFHYVAPLVPLLVFWHLYFQWRAEGGVFGRRMILLVLLIGAAFSQEQLGATVAFMMLLIGVYELYEKKFSVWNVIYFAVALGCALYMMTSPGILDRADNNQAGLLVTIITSTYKVIRTFFCMENRVFIILLYVAVAAFSTAMLSKEKYLLLKLMDICAILLGVGSVLLYCCTPLLNVFAGLTLNRFYVLCVLGIPVIALLVLQIMRYYWTVEQHDRLILFCTAVGAVGCLCVLPEVHARLFVPVWFLLLPVLLDGIFTAADLVQEKNAKLRPFALWVVSAAIVVLAVMNGGEILAGYVENGAVHRYNDAVLSEAAERSRNGEAAQAIFLKTMPKPVYTGVMPYDEGVQSMKYWIDNYYGCSGETCWYYSEEAAEQNTELYTELGNGIYVLE